VSRGEERYELRIMRVVNIDEFVILAGRLILGILKLRKGVSNGY